MNAYKSGLLIALLLPATGFFMDAPAEAQSVLCTKQSNNAITIRNRRCRRTETRITNRSELVGAQGEAGIDGADGSNGLDGTDGAVRVWGDGSAGVGSISGTYAETNPQFTDIEFGVTSIDSGVTIRATGVCTISGTVTVGQSAPGGIIGTISATTIIPMMAFAPKNLAFNPATPGEFGTSAATVLGGFPGSFLTQREARSLTRIPASSLIGGPGGPAYQNPGGAAGGAIALYCQGGIEITASGAMQASGNAPSTSGGGGGSGGLILLASAGTINNAGTLNADGGIGGTSGTFIGAGGGGGGGIIHYLAPTVSVTGSNTVAGGAAGNNASSVTNARRFGGSGGGAFGGSGGLGGTVLTDNSASAATAGSSGVVLTTTADPTSLLM